MEQICVVDQNRKHVGAPGRRYGRCYHPGGAARRLEGIDHTVGRTSTGFFVSQNIRTLPLIYFVAVCVPKRMFDLDFGGSTGRSIDLVSPLSIYC